MSFFRFEVIDWVESQGDYVGPHACGKNQLLCQKIGNPERLLLSTEVHPHTPVNHCEHRQIACASADTPCSFSMVRDWR